MEREIIPNIIQQSEEDVEMIFIPDLSDADGDLVLEKEYRFNWIAETGLIAETGTDRFALPVDPDGTIRYKYLFPKAVGKSFGFFHLSPGAAIALGVAITLLTPVVPTYLSSIDDAIDDHEAEANPHSIYLTQAEGDALYGGGASALDDLTDVTLTAPANDDILQRKAGLFVNRTIAQVKTDLALNNVPNVDAVTVLRNGVAGAGDDLAKLYALYQAISAIVGGTAPDGNSVADTVAEILAVFATYPEGVDILLALAAKAPLNNPTFTDKATAPQFVASGAPLNAFQIFAEYFIGLNGTAMYFRGASYQFVQSGTFNDLAIIDAGGVSVPDAAYGTGWNGSTYVPTRNAVYDAMGRTPVDKTEADSPVTLTAADSGKWYGNTGATGNTQFNLPASAGCIAGQTHYYFTVLAAQDLIVAVDGLESIIGGSSAPSGQPNVVNGTISSGFELWYRGGGQWVMSGIKGTWAEGA